MNFLSLIEAKRDGRELPLADIREAVDEFTGDRLPDYQVAAFLMAVCLRGLTPQETAALTLAMRDSGDRLILPNDPRPVVDKHSTGGVGDKVSLVLAPLLACLGFRVPMISGRGLGITGGTLDKLDSIPGFRTSLPAPRIVDIVQECGCVICGQTERMVPADRKLYALRDVTGTVPSIPLIVASILSKKLVEGLDALILDVKFGRAAFMQTREHAEELARAMVELGKVSGLNTRALLTRMDAPLGRAAGNWLEVKEAVECAAGVGPADLRELVLASAGHLLAQTAKVGSTEDGISLAAQSLASGQPLHKLRQMLEAQSANLEAFERRLTFDHTARAVVEVRAERSGFVVSCDAKAVGELVRDLGGGRLTKDAALDYDAGVDMLARPGAEVKAGDILGRVHAREAALAERARDRLASVFVIAAEPPAPVSLIAGTV